MVDYTYENALRDIYSGLKEGCIANGSFCLERGDAMQCAESLLPENYEFPDERRGSQVFLDMEEKGLIDIVSTVNGVFPKDYLFFVLRGERASAAFDSLNSGGD
jgi:hypothetical protein